MQGRWRMDTPVPNSLVETRLPRHRVLVCLARSPFSERCVPHAVSLARTFGSAVTLLHVMPSRAEEAGPKANDALGWEISRQEAQVYLDRIEKEVAHALGHPVEVRLEQGHPAERIVDVAREIETDLTILGSQCQETALAWRLGGTVQRVLALVGGSVFVAHSVSNSAVAVNPTRILVPLDGSLRTESVLPTATRLANEHRAELILVHIVPESPPTAFLAAVEDVELTRTLAAHRESGARAYLERLQQQLVREGTPVHVVVARYGNESQGLLEVSRREQADLIVLSAHGLACDPGRSFGSVTTYLLAHAPVPLLVLQDLPEHGLPHPHDLEGKLPPPLRAS